MNEKTETPRTCANCACHEIKTIVAGANSQSFCRRNPPISTRMRVEAPVFDRQHNPVFLKDGKTPRTEITERDIYIHMPTDPSLVCFDGWRPLGMLPGEDVVSKERAEMIDGYRRLLNDLEKDRTIGLDPELDTH